ncbi:unnamed protein product [Symbiodinium sp. CCMP2592]|nr:unnamed protein product [Symbiodinium sp. CCMP2592]
MTCLPRKRLLVLMSCLAGLTCPTWGRPSEVSFLERSSRRKGQSSTRLDGSLLGKTNCGIAACCNHCPVDINVNINFAKISQAIASIGADIKKLDSDLQNMVKEIGEGLQAIAKAISQLDAGILAVGAALLADLSIIEGQLAGKIDLSILVSEAIEAVQQIRYIQKTYMNPLMQNPRAFPEETLQQLQNDILEPTRGIGFQLSKIQDAMAGRGFPGIKPLLETYRENGAGFLQLGEVFGFFLAVQFYGSAQLYWASLKTFGSSHTVDLAGYNRTQNNQIATLQEQLLASWGPSQYLHPCLWDGGWNCAVEECDFHSAWYPFPKLPASEILASSCYFCNTISAGSYFQVSIQEGNVTMAVTRQTNVLLTLGFEEDYTFRSYGQLCQLCLAVSDSIGALVGKYCVRLPKPSEYCRAGWLTVSTNQTHASADLGMYCDGDFAFNILSIPMASAEVGVALTLLDNASLQLCAGDSCEPVPLVPVNRTQVNVTTTWENRKLPHPIAYEGCKCINPEEWVTVSPKAGASGLRCAALCQHAFRFTRSYASSSSSVDGACMCSWALPQEDCPGECVACPQLPATWCSKSKNMTTAAIYTWDSDTGNLQFA